jgi:plasmid stabilization system protein ParE
VKRYEVIVTPEAEASIIAAFQYIYQRAPMNAERWLKKLYSSIGTLETFPRRCAFARECEYFEEELRQLIFKSHRVVFRVDEEESKVWVLYFVHGRQRAVGEAAEPEETS